MRSAFLLLPVVVAALSCVGRAASSGDVPAGVAQDAGSASPVGYSTHLDSVADVEAFALEDHPVDFFLPGNVGEPVAPVGSDCIFLDGAVYPTHLDFLNALGDTQLDFGEYVALAIEGPERVWWSGSIRFAENEIHPVSGERGVLLWVIYSHENFTTDDIVAAYDALRPCTEDVHELLAFGASGSAQVAPVVEGQAELDAAGIAFLDPAP